MCKLIQKTTGYLCSWYWFLSQPVFSYNRLDYIKSKKVRQQHPFHLVDPSTLPFSVALSIYLLVVTFLIVFNGIETIDLASLLGSTFSSSTFMFSGVLKSRFFLPLCITIFLLADLLISWFSSMLIEASAQGCHTQIVQKNMQFGFFLFILSEIMFFFGFFWGYFHMCLNPSVTIGCVWPPKGIAVFDIWALPFLNTVILLSSGVSITIAHRALVSGDLVETSTSLLLTIICGLCFAFGQWSEYDSAPFAINDGVYGSLFFLLTGFHGIHVCIGILFLFICYLRSFADDWAWKFTRRHHVGFICAAWYWHFVDVVWLFLFIVVYWWGS